MKPNRLTADRPGPTGQAVPFDLRELSIPAEEIRGGGPPKDGIPAITKPKTVTAAEARFLKTTDRVIGVSLGGQPRP